MVSLLFANNIHQKIPQINKSSIQSSTKIALVPKTKTSITAKACTIIAHTQTLRIVGFMIVTYIMALLDNCDKVTL
jgi:hypothetical protein